jgi:hypothetical protein
VLSSGRDLPPIEKTERVRHPPGGLKAGPPADKVWDNEF